MANATETATKTAADAAKVTTETAKKAAEQIKTTVESVTAASSQAFKDQIEKSITAFNDLNSVGKQNLEAVVASVTAATKGAETLSADALAYSKKHMEDSIAAAKALSTARSVQELVELQSTYAKSALEAYIAQATKFSEILTASVKDSVKPLNERATAMVEKIQAAR